MMRIEEYILQGKFQPDWEGFLENIQGKRLPRRVHFAELLVDPEIVAAFGERYLNVEVAPHPGDPKRAIERYVSFFSRLGYDYCLLVDVPGLTLQFPGRSRVGEDMALLSRGERTWVEEGRGIIASFADLERYPWPRVENFDFSLYEYLVSLLPEGMGLLVNACGGIFETVSENLLGLEGLSYLLYDEPELVVAVFQQVGEILLHFYRTLLDLPGVVGVFQGDDLGYKTSTFVSPQVLRQFVLPWHGKLSSLCHARGKCYFLHSCGMILPLMEEFIEEVQIDAFHSFQEEVFPVTAFKARYGHRVGVLGGVDVDYLACFEETKLRRYVRSVLEAGMQGGRYALGSGNSVANYIPLQNYLIMLDEGLQFLV